MIKAFEAFNPIAIQNSISNKIDIFKSWRYPTSSQGKVGSRSRSLGSREKDWGVSCMGESMGYGLKVRD